MYSVSLDTNSMYVNVWGKIIMVEQKRLSKSEQSKVTISRLIEVATKEFSRRGYAGVSTETIVREANVTRGALYHHFKGKKELFYAVFKEAQREIGKRIEERAIMVNDSWQALIEGCCVFLEACSDPGLQQIVVIDAPAVLEWSKLREVDATMPDSGLAILKQCLEELRQQNCIKDIPLDALAHLLSGAMDEAAVWIAQSDRHDTALGEAQSALKVILESLKQEE